MERLLALQSKFTASEYGLCYCQVSDKVLDSYLVDKAAE